MSGDLERARADIEALFDAWEAAWTDPAADAFNAICTAEVQYEDPLTPEPLVGPAELAGHAGRLRTAFPDARLQPLGARLGDGHMAAAPVKLTGTHTGPLAAIPASGRSLTVQVVFYCELQGGKIHRVRAFFDLYGAAVQLGVLPGHGSLGERAMMVMRGFGWRR